MKTLKNFSVTDTDTLLLITMITMLLKLFNTDVYYFSRIPHRSHKLETIPVCVEVILGVYSVATFVTIVWVLVHVICPDVKL